LGDSLPVNELLSVWDFLLAFGVHLAPACVVAAYLLVKTRLIERINAFVILSAFVCSRQFSFLCLPAAPVERRMLLLIFWSTNSSMHETLFGKRWKLFLLLLVFSFLHLPPVCLCCCSPQIPQIPEPLFERLMRHPWDPTITRPTLTCAYRPKAISVKK
jgi:hypothetical protein